MSNTKNKEFKNKIKQAVQSAENPGEIYSRVQESLQGVGSEYSRPQAKSKYEQPPIDYSQYDISQLMEKLGKKMPPGIKQMMEQFVSIIPASGNLDSDDFKKQMKKKMKSFKSTFKSPYE